jgi:hypothetical protein
VHESSPVGPEGEAALQTGPSFTVAGVSEREGQPWSISQKISPETFHAVERILPAGTSIWFDRVTTSPTN